MCPPFISVSVQRLHCLFLLYSLSFFLSASPTRAPSPLFSRRLIIRSASQQEYLRKEKSPLLHTGFLSLPSVLLFAPLLYFFLTLIFSFHFFFTRSPFSSKSCHNGGFNAVARVCVLFMCVCDFKCVS